MTEEEGREAEAEAGGLLEAKSDASLGNVTKPHLYKYNKIIFRIIKNLDNDIRDIKYTVDKNPQKQEEPSVAPATPEAQLDFQELAVDKSTNLNPRYTFDSFFVSSSFCKFIIFFCSWSFIFYVPIC